MPPLTTPAGAALAGEFDGSAGPGAPAVLVLHEWWGLNAQLLGVAKRLAAEGFQTFAVDLFHGKHPKDATEAAAAMGALNAKQALVELQAVVQALLLKSGERVGTLGFCMGGAYALATAAHNPEVKAAVAYYGIPSAPTTDVSRIQGSVLGHFASRDTHVSPARVDALEETLRSAGVPNTIHRYTADHAFANETRPEVFAPEAAQLAWARTLAFLHAELDGPSPALVK